MPQEHGAEPLKHMGRGKKEGDDLECVRQGRDRIKHRGKRLDNKDESKGEDLRLRAVAENNSRGKYPRNPPEKKQVFHKGDEVEAEHKDIEVIKKKSEPAQHNGNKGNAD